MATAANTAAGYRSRSSGEVVRADFARGCLVFGGLGVDVEGGVVVKLYPA